MLNLTYKPHTHTHTPTKTPHTHPKTPHTMPTYEAQILKQYSDPITASLSGWPLLRTRHDKQRNPCWSTAEKIEMIDTVLRGWTCPPIYIIEHHELTDTVPDGEQHVFDGAHKLESVFEFMNDVFPLKKTASSCPEIIEHDGKRFSKLPIELRHRIRQYNFVINIIDPVTAKDEDKLATLWERLNRAGKKVNNFELAIPKIGGLLETVIRPSMDQFYGSMLFPASKSERGNLEQRLMLILAIHDDIRPKCYSNNKMIKTWQESTAPIRESRTELWIDVLVRARKMLDDLRELNVFHNDAGELLLHDAHTNIELPYVLGRLAMRFPRIELFRHKKRDIAPQIKTAIVAPSPAEMVAKEGLSARNATFQKRIHKRICELIDSVAGAAATDGPRLFTKKDKAQKLRDQDGICTLCSQKILPHQVKDGDHIVEWCNGGPTTYDNLQIVHRHCHQEKTATASISHV